MASTISSRTPDGVPNHCPICGAFICIEPSHPQGDAPCPNCGTLLWFFNTSAGMRFHESKAVAPLRDRIFQLICEKLRLDKGQVASTTSLGENAGSLDIVEFVMELEGEIGVTIPDEEAEKIRTVGDLIDYIANQNL
jgi:acyl carrier protein